MSAVATRHLPRSDPEKKRQATPNAPCDHDNAAFRLGVDIRSGCACCGTAFEFVVPPVGVSPHGPSISLGRTDLLGPLRAVSRGPGVVPDRDEDRGQGRPLRRDAARGLDLALPRRGAAGIYTTDDHLRLNP